jgi:hypothetical protein
VKRVLALVLVAAAALALAAPSMSTTAPGYNFKINVVITKNSVVLSRSLAKRGWLAHFVIQNRDSKPHTFDVGGLHPKKPIPAHGTGKVGAFLDDRGQYPYKVDGKIRGYFVVN